MEKINTAPPPPENPDNRPTLLGGDLGPNPLGLYDRDYFLRMFDRRIPDYFIEGIKIQGDGYELFQAMAAVGARASLAVFRSVSGLFIAWASDGVRATGQVELYRDNALKGAVLVKAGSVVSTSRKNHEELQAPPSTGGRKFVTLSDVQFEVADVGPHTVAAQAIAPGWEYNVSGAVRTAAGETIPGEIDTVYELFTDPPFADPTIQVRQIADFSGGQAACLAQLGRERSVVRYDAEPAEAYRARVRQLSDTVSPNAIKRAVFIYLHSIIGNDTEFWFIEPWQLDYQTVWDGPSQTVKAYKPNVFVFDDPRTGTPMFNRWMSEEDAAGAVIIQVPNLRFMDEMGGFFDDPGTDEADFATPGHTGWRRAFGFFDIPHDAAASLTPGIFFDAWDVPRRATYSGLHELLQKIKLGGVMITIEIYNDI